MKRKIIAVLIFVLFVLPLPTVLLVPETVQNDFQYRLQSGPEVALSRSYLSDLQSGNFSKIINNIDLKYRASTTPEVLKKMQGMLPAKPQQVRLLGDLDTVTNGKTQSDVTWEYVGAGHAMLASVSLRHTGGKTTIWGIHLTPLSKPVEAINALSFHGRNGWYYVFSVVTALIWLFWLYTIYVWLYTDMPRRRTKVLWGLAILLLSLPAVSLNWTTGDLHFEILRLGFAAGLAHSGYAPWYMSFALPLGALAFWGRRLLRRSSPG